MRISITGKICFILLIIFSLVLISTTLYQTFRERELVLRFSNEQVSSLLQNYKNDLDLLISEHQPDRLAYYQQGLLKQKYVLSMKWVRDQSNDVLGPLKNENLPTDQHENMALQGQSFQQTMSAKGQTKIITIMPYFLPTQTGTDRKPVAAIRIEYSLDKQLDTVEQHIFISAIMLSVIFSGVLLMTLAIIRKQVVLPLQNLRQAIDNVADFDDLSNRLPVVHNDEIDQVNESFNQLMEHLSGNEFENKKLAETNWRETLPPLS